MVDYSQYVKLNIPDLQNTLQSSVHAVEIGEELRALQMLKLAKTKLLNAENQLKIEIKAKNKKHKRKKKIS